MKGIITEQRQAAAASDTLKRLCPPNSDMGLLFRAASDNHLDALTAIGALRARLCELEDSHAINALHSGATIEQVCDALGMAVDNVGHRRRPAGTSLAATTAPSIDVSHPTAQLNRRADQRGTEPR